jgi:hypothetical protein
MANFFPNSGRKFNGHLAILGILVDNFPALKKNPAASAIFTALFCLSPEQ